MGGVHIFQMHGRRVPPVRSSSPKTDAHSCSALNSGASACARHTCASRAARGWFAWRGAPPSIIDMIPWMIMPPQACSNRVNRSIFAARHVVIASAALRQGHPPRRPARRSPPRSPHHLRGSEQRRPTCASMADQAMVPSHGIACPSAPFPVCAFAFWPFRHRLYPPVRAGAQPTLRFRPRT